MVTSPQKTTHPSQVVVLIPALNEARHIDAVLTRLVQGDPVASSCPVIVADGGSTDGTQQIVTRFARRHPNVRLLNNPGRTQAHAMNQLLDPRFNETRIAVRCDAHALYPERFVARLVAALEARPEVASIVIPMDAVSGTGCFQRGLALIADTRLGAGGSPHRGGTVSGPVDHGHHAAFRLDSFRALGGYDVSFRANEDAEYDRRLTRSGRAIWLEASIRIGYFPRDSVARLWRQYVNYGAGRARTCLKHAAPPALRQMIPVLHVLLLALSALLAPVSPLALVWPVTYGAIVTTAGVVLAIRHRTWCGLAGVAALATMHTAWGLGFLWGLRHALSRPTLRWSAEK